MSRGLPHPFNKKQLIKLQNIFDNNQIGLKKLCIPDNRDDKTKSPISVLHVVNKTINKTIEELNKSINKSSESSIYASTVLKFIN